jgi:hypothetical protein
MPDENNNPDFLDRVAKTQELWTGEEWQPEHTVDSFGLYGVGKRIEALEQIDQAIATADTSNIKRYTKLTSLRRDLANTHHALRKVNR